MLMMTEQIVSFLSTSLEERFLRQNQATIHWLFKEPNVKKQ